MRYRLLWGALALLLPGQIGLVIAVPASAVSEEPTHRALEWFKQKKKPDGALPGYQNGFTIGGTADGVLAIAAAGENPGRFGPKSDKTPVEYLEDHAGDDSSENEPRDDAHLAGKVALAVAVAGKRPNSVGGVDLVKLIRDRYDPSTGGYRGGFKTSEINPLGQSLAFLGLVSAREQVPAKAFDYLVNSQQPDGGWEFGPGFGSDVHSTSMALQSLLAVAHASGEEQRMDDAISRAMTFLHSQQNADGGFSYQKKFAANGCSGTKPSEIDATGLAIQAIRAAGQDPTQTAWRKPGGQEPGRFLTSVQNSDGSFSFQQGPDCPGDGGSTQAAIFGLEQISFPCLLEQGPCASPEAPEGATPGSLQEAAPRELAPGVSKSTEGAGEISKPPARGARSAARPASRGRPAAPGQPPATPSCGPAPCPPLPSAAPLDLVPGVPLDTTKTGPPAPRRMAGPGPLAGKRDSGPNMIIVGGAVLALALAGSITRQLLTGRSRIR